MQTDQSIKFLILYVHPRKKFLFYQKIIDTVVLW